MKSIKLFGLAALAALLAMAFVGAPSVMAGATILCSNDSEESCSEVAHVHETTLSGSTNQATLLSSVINVKCDVLFLGDALSALGSPTVIHGDFSYSNCNNGCTVTEVSEDSLLEVLRLSHETAGITGEGEVNVHCGFFINCTYSSEGLEGTGEGPLLAASETNGEVSISGQETSLVSGFCPEQAFLDIRTTPLSATYIRTSDCRHYVGGRYNESSCMTEGTPRLYELYYE